ncbi:MAG: trypsin-like peptidase domain-containing protein, partial [Rhodothermales bacterium]|nr:trypsin-like peptidase domain-containing protein [Rhodothermales bacterium]
PRPSSDSIAMSALANPMALSETFRNVATLVKPAVVFIRVDMAVDESQRRWLPSFRARRQSVGSGVIISEDGYLVTNNHVVDNAEEIWVTLDDKRQFPAEVVGTDASTDLAVIRVITDERLPSTRLGDSDEVAVGDWVIAIGNPFRLTSTVTAGIVSALGRQVNIIEGDFSIEDFIQTDAAINPGNSGGALVNMRGELIGINTAIATESGSYEGYGFAVPTNLMDRVAQDLIAYGEVRRGFLGVEISSIDADMARQLGLKRIGGVLLTGVHTGTFAHEAGLKQGDVVLTINGRRVDAPNELQRTVARFSPGDLLEVDVWRDESVRRFQVRLLGRDDPGYKNWLTELQNRPQRQAPSYEPPPDGEEAETTFEVKSWGLGLQALGDRTRTRFGVDHGVYIAYVAKGSSPSLAGLPRDVVLTGLNDEEVHSLETAVGLLEKLARTGQPVVFQVRRQDGRIAFYESDVPVSTEELTP